MTIAFLGAGLLGSAMVEAARGRGESVVVWNRTFAKAKALEAHGARAVESAATAVEQASRVHLVLSDDAAVDGLLAQIAPHVDEGAVVIDHTTCSPDGTRARCEAMERAKVAFLHCPVFMSPAMAREAQGMILACGPRDRFARVEAALAAMTGHLWYLGERVDLAAANKLFGNAMLITMVAGIADVFAMGRGVGLSPAEALAVFEKFDPRVFPRGQRMVTGDFTASFELTMARKDLRLALEMAEKSGVPLAALPAIAKRFDDVIAQGHGAEDYGVIALDAVRGGGRGGGVSEDDPVAQLESSHRRMEQRMGELLADPGDIELRERTVGYFDRSVRRHEEDEEASLFPRLEAVTELAPTIARLREEHRASLALQRALAEARDEASTTRACEALRAAYARHIEEEERVLFPAARKLLDDEAKRAIAREMNERRERGGGGGGGGGGGRRRGGR